MLEMLADRMSRRAHGFCSRSIWYTQIGLYGEVAERLKAPALKADNGESRSWVRIPPSPLPSRDFPCGRCGFAKTRGGVPRFAVKEDIM